MAVKMTHQLHFQAQQGVRYGGGAEALVPDRVRTRRLIRNICTICILIAITILFNRLLDRVGFIASPDDPSSFIPLLAPEFKAHLPWLNLWCGLALILNVVALIMNLAEPPAGWQEKMQWARLGLGVLGALILLSILM